MSVPSPDGRITRSVDIQADRVRLRTAVRGSGRPLLLITGLGASLDLGAPFERELAARGVQTVSFDAPGTVRRGGHLFLLDSAAEMAGLVPAFLSGDDRRSHPTT